MKQLVIGVVIILMLAGLGFWLLNREWTKDRGPQIGFALGNPIDGELELHVVVSRQMTMIQEPRVSTSGAQQWLDWVKDHFDVRDAAGQRLALNRSSTSIVRSNWENSTTAVAGSEGG